MRPVKAAMKKVCVLLGSPRKDGNTNGLTKPFLKRLEKRGCETKAFHLYDMELKPCLACRSCQQNHHIFGCVRQDDMQEIFDAIMDSGLLVIASPVYSWYCTPPVKMVLDRLVYGMNKYYGETKGPALWTGKPVALITTCGYPPEKGADLWEEGMKRYCRHSQLRYLGMLVERHMGYDTVFMDAEKERHAEVFAETVLRKL